METTEQTSKTWGPFGSEEADQCYERIRRLEGENLRLRMGAFIKSLDGSKEWDTAKAKIRRLMMENERLKAKAWKEREEWDKPADCIRGLSEKIRLKALKMAYEKGMSERQLAKRSRLPKSTAYRAIGGEVPLTITHLQGIASALGVKPRELMP